jgi:hypothetical protein
MLHTGYPYYYTHESGTIIFVDADGGEPEAPMETVQCDDESEFNGWAAGDKKAAVFQGEHYLKIHDENGDYRVCTLEEANRLVRGE